MHRIDQIDQIDHSHFMIYLQILQGRCIPELYDMDDLCDLAHVAGWEPYNLHDLAHVSCVGSICTVQIMHNIS